MFAEERPSFSGQYYRIEEALDSPRPIQPGGPKVIVGGGGEQRTLKIAAKHADMTHWFPLGLETLTRKKQVLADHCAAIGRDPATIELTMATPVLPAVDEARGAELLARLPPERRGSVATTPQQLADGLRPYLDLGFTGFTFNNPVLSTPESIAMTGEALALIA
jgi:alkanesulfonate monooxygenase SsuD/methylene tetrahydromethanopterin reductase-like flavin-dependent oxidoreductase (luciferase family)